MTSAADNSRRLTCLLLPLLVFACAAPLAAGDGELDLEFGNTGTGTALSYFPGEFERASAVAVDSDGRIVAVGKTGGFFSDHSFAIARYTSQGTLDPTFGNDGIVMTSFAGRTDSEATAVTFQLDGKILAAGWAGSSSEGSDFALARYNEDGSLDSTFGSAGIVLTSFRFRFAFALITAIAIQGDGRIVVGGAASLPGGAFALARYDTYGVLDPSFGVGGRVTVAFSDSHAPSIRDLAIQANNKIVVAGADHDYERRVFRLLRFIETGLLDPTFGAEGSVTTDFLGGGWSSEPAAIGIQPDGKILAAGTTQYNEFVSRFAVARYNVDGSLDSTFGDGGKLTTTVDGGGDWASDLAIQYDGKILVSGSSVRYSLYDALEEKLPITFAVLRYNSDGSLDTQFGTRGAAFADFLTHATSSALALQPDGKIVLAGGAGRGSVESFALARLNSSPPQVSITFHPAVLPPGGSFSATFSAEALSPEAYFDVRVRTPDGVEVIALNWQRGNQLRHTVPPDTTGGTWTVTGVRPHLRPEDHEGRFLPLIAKLHVVRPTP